VADPPTAPTPESSPGTPPVGSGSSDHRPRHRAGRRPLQPGIAWPLAAVGLLSALAARVCLTAPGSGEGRLAADAYLVVTAGDLGRYPLLPRGLGTLLVAGYADLTGAFSRHGNLPAVGREVFCVAVLCAALLLWRAARRLGLPDAAAAVAVLAFALPLLLQAGRLDDLPAVLGLPWLLAAGWLIAPGRVIRLAGLLAAVLAVPGVLLDPAALLLLTSGAAVLVWEHRTSAAHRVASRGRAPLVAVGLLVAVFAAVAVTLGRWDPRPTTDGGAFLAFAIVLVLVGAVAGRLLAHRRAAAVAVVATAAAGLGVAHAAPLVTALPLAAVLAAELLAAGARALVHRTAAPAVGHRAIGGVAAVLLAGGLAAVLVLPLPASRPGAASTAAGAQGPGNRSEPAATLARWVADQLPPGAHLTAGRRLVAELRRAGFPAGEIIDGGPGPSGAGPTFLVTDGAPPSGARVIGRIDRGSQPPLLVVDPSPGTPTASQLQLRRAIASALLANPTTRAEGGTRAVLQTADVDPRLLSVLAALAARSGVGIAAFPPPPHSPATGLLARNALVDATGGQPVGAGAAGTPDLVRWLQAQLPPYAPDRIDVTDSGVLIGYRYASDPGAEVAEATN